LPGGSDGLRTRVTRLWTTLIVEGMLSLAVGHTLTLVVVAVIGVRGDVLLARAGPVLARCGHGLCLAPITAARARRIDAPGIRF
jgi:hypothetical protein